MKEAIAVNIRDTFPGKDRLTILLKKQTEIFGGLQVRICAQLLFVTVLSKLKQVLDSTRRWNVKYLKLIKTPFTTRFIKWYFVCRHVSNLSWS